MKRVLILAAVLLLALSTSYPGPDPAPDASRPASTWQNVVSNVLARPGVAQPGDVYTVGIPRNDVTVTVRGITLEPSFALTSYEMFRSAGKGADIKLMGHLLLLADEVNPVMSRLMKGGLQITALHNHLLNEHPRLMDLHFQGDGAAGALAATLKDALSLTGVHLYQSASELLEDDLPPPDVQESFKQVQQILGQEGTIGRRVLQIHLPRRDPVRIGKMEVPPPMGACSCMTFQSAGPGELAATGEMVVVDSELMPVLQALRLGDLEVSAVHDYMVGEDPPLKYVHFWGKGPAERLATGLRAALDQVAIKR